MATTLFKRHLFPLKSNKSPNRPQRGMKMGEMMACPFRCHTDSTTCPADANLCLPLPLLLPLELHFPDQELAVLRLLLLGLLLGRLNELHRRLHPGLFVPPPTAQESAVQPGIQTGSPQFQGTAFWAGPHTMQPPSKAISIEIRSAAFGHKPSFPWRIPSKQHAVRAASCPVLIRLALRDRWACSNAGCSTAPSLIAGQEASPSASAIVAASARHGCPDRYESGPNPTTQITSIFAEEIC